MSRTRICLIFDLDGTLVDSEELGNRAFAELVPEIDESVDDLVRRYRGEKLSKILSDIQGRYGVSLQSDFEDRYRKRVAELFETELKPIPGVIDMLQGITAKTCIASSGPLNKIDQSLKVTGIAQYFGANRYSSYEIGPWKPEPDLYLHAAKEMDCRPADCLMIEDSPVGIEAACAAGMAALHFSASPVKPISDQYRNFTSMSELSEMLRSLEKVA